MGRGGGRSGAVSLRGRGDLQYWEQGLPLLLKQEGVGAFPGRFRIFFHGKKKQPIPAWSPKLVLLSLHTLSEGSCISEGGREWLYSGASSVLVGQPSFGVMPPFVVGGACISFCFLTLATKREKLL
eukprot:Hpha_TRINITY_DN15365_c3_g1::TRINITY_DN15365_c3_g1_i5::g.89958::m.89958